MTNQERINQIEAAFDAGMPISIAVKIAFEILADTDSTTEKAEEQMRWLLTCVLLQGKKDGAIETKAAIIQSIEQL